MIHPRGVQVQQVDDLSHLRNPSSLTGPSNIKRGPV